MISREYRHKMSQGGRKRKSGGGESFTCIICKSRDKTYKEVYLLEGKKCFEFGFISKFIQLITKQFYDDVCNSLKSQNDKNYVCRSCFMTVLNTHDSIVRLQAGVAQSIKKRLFALQKSQHDFSNLEESVDFHPIDTGRRKNLKNAELGKKGIKSLKLVCVNNRYPKIRLQRAHLNDNRIVEDKYSIEDGNIVKSFGMNLSSFNPDKNASGYRLGLESLLVAVSVVEADQPSSSNLNQRGISLRASERIEKSKCSNMPGPLSWKQQTNRFILPYHVDKHDPVETNSFFGSVQNSLLLNNHRNGNFKTISSSGKAGPLSWKRRTNRSILPDNIEKLDPLQANSLFVKKRVPICLARVKDNNIHMCIQPYCEWIFLSKCSLDNHTKYFHCGGKPHKCPHDGCGKVYAHRNKLEEHIMQHAGIKPFVCTTCGKSFAHRVNLKNHMISHTDRADVKDYKCPRPGCYRSYKYAISLKRHLNFHDGGELPFPCTYPDCGKAYKSGYELKCHFRHHTGEKPYKCDEPGCGKSFRLPGQYTVHRRNHRGECPFKCSWEGCDAAYSNRGQLENHLLSHKGKTFICDLCGKTFTYKVTMVIHRKKMHTDQRDFVCQVEGCGKAFHFRFELSAHVTKFHNAKHIGKKQRVLRGTKKVFLLYPCPAHGCTKEYVSKPNIEKHLLLVHGLVDAKLEPRTRPNLFVCSVEGCGGEFLTQRNLNYHKTSVHNSLSTQFRKAFGGKRFTCTFEGCQRIYETLTALRQHLARMHISLPTEKMCFSCGAAFRHIQQLEAHRQAMHGEESVLNEQKTGIYICKAEKCGLQFPNAEDLKQHVHTHMENPPYKCDFAGCRGTFLTEKNYNSHALNHSKHKPHDCTFQECKAKFGTQFQLLKHSVEHYGNYKCPVENCARMLISLNSARVHLLRHSGEKPYVCSVCGMAFTISSNLSRHKRTHTGEKPFECKVCLKRFSDKAVLITHMRLHTGEKPFICNVCGSCFSNLASIKNHMRLHTGDYPYVCSEVGCDKRFRDPRGLKSHKNVHCKAAQLCSQCGHVFRWGIKKHKCKTVSENVAIASTSTSDGECKKSKHYQLQLSKVKQSVLQLQHGQQLQPLPISLQHQHHDSTQLQQIQPQPLQRALFLPQHAPTEAPDQHHPQQTPLYLSSVIQHQRQNSTQERQQQPSLALIKAPQQPLQMHHPQQPQVQQTPLLNPHSQQAEVQTPYMLSNMALMQDPDQGGIPFVLDNTEPAQTVKPDAASANSLIMHDLDSNYQIVYEKPDNKQ